MLHHSFQDRTLKWRAHGTIQEESLAPCVRNEKCQGIRQMNSCSVLWLQGSQHCGCKEFNTGHHERRKMLKWATMKFGLTPAVQTLSKVVNKLFNIFFREVYDLWALNYPINPTSGAPLQPTRRQVAIWVVQEWDRITEELWVKAWTSCGYKTNKYLECDKVNDIVPYSDE